MMGVSFEPTEEQRKTVRAMSGFGIPQDDIATLLEIDAKTLRKHFRRELDRGMVEATAKVAQSLFLMATQGKNVAAAIFWMKARAGWREKHPEGGTEADRLTINVLGRGGPGLAGMGLRAKPVDQYTDAELKRMIDDLSDEIAEVEAQASEAETPDEPSP